MQGPRIPIPALGGAGDLGLPVYRLSLLGLLLVAFPAALMLGMDGQLGLDAFRQHQFAIVGFVAGKPILAAIAFMAVYAMAVAVSIPGAAFLTMVGGYLFGWLEGSLFVMVAATLASTAVFLLARSTLAETVRVRAGPSIQRFGEGFRNRAFMFVLTLHLVPIFPYGMIIALPAAFGVKIVTFVAATFVGLLPGTFLLAHLGAGVGHILRGEAPLELASFLTPQILGAAAGLGALALLPVAYRFWSPRRR